VRRRLTSVVAAVVLVGCGGGSSIGASTIPAPKPRAASAADATAAASTNTLAFDLLPRLGRASDNVIFSPYSVQAALAMVYAGAAGQTSAQIGHVLGGSSASELGASNRALAVRLRAATAAPPGARAKDAATLNLANSLWLSSHLSLEQQFSRALVRGFGAIPRTADFEAHPEAARQAINSWVASRTAHVIDNLMPPGSIGTQTVLVLANAIYLKAHWSNPFSPRDTAFSTFVNAMGARVRTEFMTQPPAEFGYLAGHGFVAVDLPYLYTHLSMLLVMPGAGTTLASFQRQLSPGQLSAISRSLVSRMVKLRMPRFHLIAHEGLNAVLASLGMPIAFTNRADFSKITPTPPLLISTVQHAADLAVDEQGTVAAAATGIAIQPTAGTPGPVTRVTLDHPFLLFLRDDQSGAILFAGRVADPSRP
jgi:serine protease inhibitor